MPRRLAAIMYTDVVGFTASAQANEAAALARLREQERIVRPLFKPYKGREIKSTGDGFLVEFKSALGALECAVEIQRRMRERNSKKPGPPLELRIGIHVGDVEESGGDIFGDAVNVASRIVPLADPGGVCLSGQVFDHVQNKVAYQLDKLSAPALKGVRGRTDVYRAVLPWNVEERTEGGPVLPRIAVLPLANFSPDPNDEYFADGLTEELIATISKIRELNVVSRTSVMPYRSHTKHTPDIGRELGVGTILEGSVRKAGSRVRIAVQLIDAASDRHLWAENYDRSLEDVFSIQSEIAEKVAKELQVRLLEPDRARIGRVPTENTEAHLLYLKGLYNFQRQSKEGFLTAMTFFEQAIQKDPGFALAYVGLSGTYGMLTFWDMMPRAEADAKIEAAARKAIELDETLAEAHIRLGWTQFPRDVSGALRELQRAADFDPNSASAHVNLGNMYGFLRRYKEGVAETQRALELDSQSEATLAQAASNYLFNGRPDRAAELYTKAAQLNPSDVSVWDNLGVAHIRLGRFDEGIAEIKKAIEMSMGSDPSQKADLAYALSRAGRLEEARGVLSELIQYHDKSGMGATQVASALASFGDTEAAFEWLEKAFNERSGYLISVSNDFPFEGMHSDSRFQRFLERLGYPKETASA